MIKLKSYFPQTGKQSPDLKIKMNGHRIYPSSSIKYIGMHLDETLNGAFHAKILSKKLKRANGMLCKARHYVLKDDLRTLYFAIVSSHLIYASQIWGQITNTFNPKIFKLQNLGGYLVFGRVHMINLNFWEPTHPCTNFLTVNPSKYRLFQQI